tara:strand:+ start:542 stop:670 length:129 start_codon:yes stop_codon:yes gene_type:complete
MMDAKIQKNGLFHVKEPLSVSSAIVRTGLMELVEAMEDTVLN